MVLNRSLTIYDNPGIFTTPRDIEVANVYEVAGDNFRRYLYRPYRCARVHTVKYAYETFDYMTSPAGILKISTFALCIPLGRRLGKKVLPVISSQLYTMPYHIANGALMVTPAWVTACYWYEGPWRLTKGIVSEVTNAGWNITKLIVYYTWVAVSFTSGLIWSSLCDIFARLFLKKDIAVEVSIIQPLVQEQVLLDNETPEFREDAHNMINDEEILHTEVITDKVSDLKDLQSADVTEESVINCMAEELKKNVSSKDYKPEKHLFNESEVENELSRKKRHDEDEIQINVDLTGPSLKLIDIGEDPGQSDEEDKDLYPTRL